MKHNYTMRSIKRIINKQLAGLLLVAIVVYGCGTKKQAETINTDRFEMLISYIESSGDFINSPQAPAVLGITEVLSYAGSKMLMIDLRHPEAFEKGHIESAVSVQPKELIDYFETRIDPSSFDTIVLLSDDGQDALFAVSLLRLLGYDQVFGVRYGMAWHKDFADIWKTNISSRFQDKLVYSASPEKVPQVSYPVITSPMTDGYALLRDRAQALLEQNPAENKVSAADVFANPSSFYIVCYWNEQEYLTGHIPGSVLYLPKKSLSRTTALKTLPAEKPIVVYCNSGHHSSAAAAYLRLLGYNAKTLSFGTNGFMYDIHKEKIVKGLYSDSEMLDFPLRTKDATAPGIKPGQMNIKKSSGGC
jgi:rhodanese-related sulfurtransferase